MDFLDKESEFEHEWLRRCLSPHKLLHKCKSLSAYHGRLKKQAKEYAGDEPEGDSEGHPKSCGCPHCHWLDIVFKYIGDGGEVLVWQVLNQYGRHPDVGLYYPHFIDRLGRKDLGLDIIGTGVDLKPAGCQVKFWSRDEIVTQNKGHLGNFFQEGVDLGIDPKSPYNWILATSAKDAHYSVQDHWKNRLRVLNEKRLSGLINPFRTYVNQETVENTAFWDRFRSDWRNVIGEDVWEAKK